MVGISIVVCLCVRKGFCYDQPRFDCQEQLQEVQSHRITHTHTCTPQTHTHRYMRCDKCHSPCVRRSSVLMLTACVWERMSVACFNRPGSTRNAPISYMDNMLGKVANTFSQPTNACCLMEGQFLFMTDSTKDLVSYLRPILIRITSWCKREGEVDL